MAIKIRNANDSSSTDIINVSPIGDAAHKKQGLKFISKYFQS